VPPVARYPSRLQAGVTILSPHCQALAAGLGEHPVVLGGGAIGVADGVAIRCLGTRLKSTTAQAVGLCQVEQQGSPKGPDHPRTGNKLSSTLLSVAHESSEAGGGDDLKHRSGARGG
jgi:hypothetical protein